MQISGVNNPLEAAKWGKTPVIQKKAAEASKNAMTDDYVEKLVEQARKDAKAGVGMSQEAIQLQHSQMAKYVSPDRSGPMAQMSQELQKAAREHKETQDPTLEFFDRMLDQLNKKPTKYRIDRTFSGLSGGCSGDLCSTPENQVATVYSPDGEQIANYNTSSGGWQILTTKAESTFLGESNRIYAQAYKDACAEMKAPQAPAQSAEPSESTVDFRA